MHRQHLRGRAVSGVKKLGAWAVQEEGNVGAGAGGYTGTQRHAQRHTDADRRMYTQTNIM